ncbi:LOW QUALITY PROTEIN: hypothetical protein V1477_019033, partial [Vespula maculifrons]
MAKGMRRKKGRLRRNRTLKLFPKDELERPWESLRLITTLTCDYNFRNDESSYKSYFARSVIDCIRSLKSKKDLYEDPGLKYESIFFIVKFSRLFRGGKKRNKKCSDQDLPANTNQKRFID